MNYSVSASVLSADMMNLEKEIRHMEESGVDMLHFDVMDGIFVDNITYGLPILQQVDKITEMTLDVHLMITDPLRYAERFADFGADIITFHYESKSDVRKTIDAIHSKGIKAAVSVKPLTPVEEIYEFLPDVEMILVMTVEPGFGGQSFISDTLEKVRKLREKITELGLNVDIQVDGGINSETAALVKKAGANILVSGSWLFKSEDMAASVRLLKEVSADE